ncbi:MAG: SIR2 family protein [Nitrospirae bacterium]|nr:SIR2 family protein [Nitrospirota bacterium]
MSVVLFTGAGLGVPLGLPTALGFFNDLKNMNHPILGTLFEYLDSNGKNKEDIEVVLAELEDFIKDDLSDFIFGQEKTGEILANYHNKITNRKTNARTIIEKIKKNLYEKLKINDREKAFKLYFNIFSEIKKPFPTYQISFFTSNYDLSFDEAFSMNVEKWNSIGLNDIDDGFKKARGGKNIFDTQRVFEGKDNNFEYLKIHGSLDWHGDGDQCYKGYPTTPDDPDSVPIIYPGEKAVPEKEPFKTLHFWLLDRLLKADVIIVIGFAFRDSLINLIFENALNTEKTVPLHYFNPCSRDDFSLDSKVPYFLDKFPRKFIHHQIAIDEETPLSIEKHIAQPR